jgi:hypothetical protein
MHFVGVECTHNGTGGTGTLTLVSVTGSPTLISVLGSTGTRWFKGAIHEYTSSAQTVISQTETGIYSINLATGVMTRSKVETTWTGGVYSCNSPSPINVGATAANVRIICTLLPTSAPEVIPFEYTGSAGFYTADDLGLHSAHAPTGTGTLALTANQEIWAPFRWTGTREIIQAGIRVNTASGTTGSQVKLSIHDLLNTGAPGAKIKDLPTLPTDATGNIAGSVTGLWLPPGWYWTCILSSSGTAALVKLGVSSISPAGTSNGTAVQYITRTGSFSSGIPDPAPTSGGTPVNNNQAPMIFLKQAA